MAIRRHIKYNSVKERNTIKNWHNKMKNMPAFIIGNGPSLNDINTDLLLPYFTIGINRCFYKIDPTILLWQDIELWYTERKRILRLSALKVCRNISDPQNRFFHFKLQNGPFNIPENPQSLHGRGTTGPLAVQFAYSLGCDPIILLGCDCKEKDGLTDFYGRNRHHKPHTMRNCRQGLLWIKEAIKDKTIISCSDNDIFENKNFNDVISEISIDYKKNRNYWTNLLT